MGRRHGRDRPRRKCEKQSALSMFTTYIKGEKRSARKAFPHSRSYVARKLRTYEQLNEQHGISGTQVIEQESFYDIVTGTCSSYQPKLSCMIPQKARFRMEGQYDAVDSASQPSGSRGKPGPVSARVSPEVYSGFKVTPSRSPDTYARQRDKRGEGDEEGEDERDGDEVDLIPDAIEHIYDNSNRHSIGIGLLSKIFGSGKATEVEGYDEDRDSRPFFTYWISLVQIIIFITVIATYGIAPYGTGINQETDMILMTSQTIEKVERDVLTNFWVGPRLEDLIHVGARYSMCMRNDTNLEDVMKEDRKEIKQTACCVQNDGSGCIQSLEENCSPFLATWMGWSEDNPRVSDGRTSGSVCGLDPLYCRKPSYDWPDDISEWPICDKETDITDASDYHMTCEVLGRPCCHGIQGECELTTPEYCDFLDGFYHKDASLCSQVNCMEDVCGMLPFADPDTPDQFYRLFSTQFLHAGILDLVITVLIQVLFMRDLEKLISSWRVVIIYVGSGICGSLASACFIPYYVEAGPSGSTYGIIAALYLEVLRFERRVKNNEIWKVLLKMAISLIILFVIGLFLPSIDNYAHMFGFLFGLLISYSLRPYRKVCNYSLKTWTLVVIGVICGLAAAAVFAVFIVIFYVAPQKECDACINLNCIPFTDTYCDSIKIRLRDD